jgi:hypothetical protein
MSTLSLTELRAEIAILCSEVATGRQTIDAVLTGQHAGHDNPAWSYVYVVKVLEQVPGIGKVAARRILSEIGIEDRCSVGSLTDLERKKILQAVSQ